MKRNKKPLLLGVLAVLLVAFAVGGTLAWMTAQDSKVNAFTVGTFDNPTKDPETDDPDTDADEDEEESANPNTDGFLTETAWKENQTFIPGDPVAKNPNVGVAKTSVNPYVFIFVKNNALDTTATADVATYGPYFTIENQWKSVTDTHDSGEGNFTQDVTPTNSKGAGAPSGAFVDGLFMYVGDNTFATTPQILDVSKAASDAENVYTGDLFETITLPDGNAEGIDTENANVSVYAFIYGSKTGVGDGEEGSAQAALDAAIQWAEEIKATK